MDVIGLRLMFVTGLLALAGLAALLGPLIAFMGARWRWHRGAATRAAVSARRTVTEDGSRERALQFRQMLWRSLL